MGVLRPGRAARGRRTALSSDHQRSNQRAICGNAIRSVPIAGVPAGELGTVLVGSNHWYQRPSHPNWSPDGTTLVFQRSGAETFTSDLCAWTGTGDPVNLTGTETAWPPENQPTAPHEAGPTFLANGRLIFVQDGNVFLMAAQPGAQRMLIADLPYSVRNVDARGRDQPEAMSRTA